MSSVAIVSESNLAAQTFFNKTPDKLKTEESAILVGLLKAPTYYSPVRNPENATRRRNTVLYQMRKYELLTKAEFDSLKTLPIVLHYQSEDHNVGLATYFREYLRLYLTSCAMNIRRLMVQSIIFTEMDLRYIPQLIPECSVMLKRL